jgi:hypothetical protein
MATQMFSAVVAAPGTPQLLTSSTVPAQAAVSGGLGGSISPRGCYISLTAPHSNTAGKYIYVGGPTMNVAAKTGIGFELLTGSLPQVIFLTDGETDLGDLYIDTDSVAITERLYVATIG